MEQRDPRGFLLSICQNFCLETKKRSTFPAWPQLPMATRAMKASPSSSRKLSQRAGLLAVLPAHLITLLFHPSHPCSSSLGQSHIPAWPPLFPWLGLTPQWPTLGAAEAQRELRQDKWRCSVVVWDTEEEEPKPLLLLTQAIRMEGKKCLSPQLLAQQKLLQVEISFPVHHFLQLG